MSAGKSGDPKNPLKAGDIPHPRNRRKQDHPVEVKVFGGTRVGETRIGVGWGLF